MSYRGSLTQCIDMLGSMYGANETQWISIIQVPRGKYYKIMTDGELEIAELDPNDGDSRLVFRGTLKELKIFQTPTAPTRELFTAGDNEQ